MVLRNREPDQGARLRFDYKQVEEGQFREYRPQVGKSAARNQDQLTTRGPNTSQCINRLLRNPSIICQSAIVVGRNCSKAQVFTSS